MGNILQKQKKLMLGGVITFILLCLFVIYEYDTFQTASRSLNIILISVDTLRPDHMSLYGYSPETTPNIDKWAKNAVVFSNAQTVIPLTYPSFSALMTGRQTLGTRIINNTRSFPLSDNTITLAKILKENKYATYAFVTNGVLSPQISNMGQGFDEYRFINYFFGITKKVDYVNFINNSFARLNENAKNRKKFFLWLHLMDVHAPYDASIDYKCKFDMKLCDTTNKLDLQSLTDLWRQFTACQQSDWPDNRKELFTSLYDGGTLAADYYVGKTLDTLDKTGLSKNTLVILYGDHGEGLDHRYYLEHKDDLYQSALHIPLVIKDPLIPFGIKSSRLIDNTDILPTILDLLAIPNDYNQIQGRSFADTLYFHGLFDQLLSLHKYIYSVASDLNKFSLYDGRYKYIYSSPDACLYKNQSEELYDIEKDPTESINLIKNQAAVAQVLKINLMRYLSNYNLPRYEPNNSNQDLMNKLKSFGY